MSAIASGIEPFGALRAAERPDVLAIDTDGTAASLQLKLPRRLPWFDGHFPDRPILPGIAQVHLAGVAARSLFGIDQRIVGTGRLKFQRPLIPDVVVTLDLSFSQTTVRFTFTHESSSVSSGSLRLIGADESVEL